MIEVNGKIVQLELHMYCVGRQLRMCIKRVVKDWKMS